MPLNSNVFLEAAKSPSAELKSCSSRVCHPPRLRWGPSPATLSLPALEGPLSAQCPVDPLFTVTLTVSGSEPNRGCPPGYVWREEGGGAHLGVCGNHGDCPR